MSAEPDIANEDGETKSEMVRQRDQALAAAILATALAISVLWRNFGVAHTELGDLQHSIAQHQQLLVENQKALGGVRAALLADQQVLAKLEQAKGK
ncbi:MAG TPA: hypothetical protein VL200_15330 [Lacunisphaera sp.]|jgi:hypothetical protein|nr:hypothetical protein [Lacunisphaera sp.]